MGCDHDFGKAKPMTNTQAKCPYCKNWSPVKWHDYPPPGGVWWVDSGCCPKCGEAVCVESECEFRLTPEGE